MISVFTPSHNPRWLDDCWTSLWAQTYRDFEWIVLLNAGAEWEPPDDPRVLVAHTSGGNVGELKAHACAMASGDVLVELDHDDALMADALQLICDAFDAHPRATLAYSDFAHMTAEGEPELTDFDLSMGWRSTTEFVQGRAFKRWHAPEPLPCNVGIIWFAPNHVRAFRESSYREVGGHDPSRRVLDDLDLMMKLYAIGPFVHIPRLLYLARVHDSNTQRDPELNAEIQRETIRMYCQRREALHAAWVANSSLLGDRS